MSAVLTSRPSVSVEFAQLINSVAKGTFFLRFSLQEHTTDHNITLIAKKASDLYERMITEASLRFVPHFKFRSIPGDRIQVVLCREGCGCEPNCELGTLDLMAIDNPDGYGRILVLDPEQFKTQLSLV